MKSWNVLLICLLISSGIWLVMNLSRLHTDIESVRVVAVSNIDGYASNASDEVTITARCKASGFALLWLGSQNDAIEVKIDARDLQGEGGDAFSLDVSKLYRYAPEIFGQGVNIESFLTSKVVFKFTPVHFKKVPVEVVRYTDYRPQYMAAGSLAIVPDSVLVYGEESKLHLVEKIETAPLTLRDVHKDERGVISLNIPAGVRLSNEFVEYNLPVSRYVELRSEVKVTPVGVPEGTTLSIFPSTVSVTFRCAFPLKEDPTSGVSAFVDYSRFRSSNSGRCVIELSELPEGVIYARVSPEICECVESQ